MTNAEQYPLEEAREEASKMQEKIKLGEAATYAEAEGIVEKEHELNAMQERIERSLDDEQTREKVTSDFLYTFGQLGLTSDRTSELCERVLSVLKSGKPLQEIEAKVLKVFEAVNVRVGDQEQNLVEVLHEKLRDRAKIIASQVKPYLDGVKGKIIDYGAGDGQATQMLHDQLNLDIEGVDVRLYKAPNVKVPIKLFNGSHVDVPDGAYETGLLTNALHHEKANEKILDELDRVVGEKLIILETVPVGESEEAMNQDKDRTFMNDYLYNRLFHNADVPVPGTYETPKGWTDRFSKHGWYVSHEEDLGFDQPTIRDRHYLLILKRISHGGQQAAMESSKPVRENDWTDFRDHLRGLREQVIEKLQLHPELRSWYNEKQFALIATIRKSGQDYYRSVAWHILAFGTPDRNDSPQLDLPGELSVEKLYQELLDK